MGTALAAFSVLRTAKGGRLETYGKRASNVAGKKVCVKMKTQSWMVRLLMKLMPFRRTERFYARIARKMDGLWTSWKLKKGSPYSRFKDIETSLFF